MVPTPGCPMPRIPTHLGAAVLLVAALMALVPAGAADLYSASAEYKKGDYAQALSDYLTLAKLGQPQAQFNVAIMYRTGRGTDASDIHAYAWAMLAAQNGQPGAKELADKIRPDLAPGSEQIAGWFTAPYTPAVLAKSLLPEAGLPKSDAADAQRKWVKECAPVSVYPWVYPDEANQKGMEGNVFIAYTLMSDGRARLPRVILDVPRGVFGAAARLGILHDGFAPRPPGSQPIQCVSFYHFVMSGDTSTDDYTGLRAYVDKARRSAQAGDPGAQLMYGILLVGLPQLRKSSNAGLPWFLRAAQAGIPQAQFEVGYSLLIGIGCAPDQGKAIKWLEMAADQNDPNAEVTLATSAMSGSPGFGDLAQARSWLEKAAAQGNLDAELYLSALLAAAPEPGLRDPQRALGILRKAFDHIASDPTAFEVRAAAQAAEADFADAAESEKEAIRKAHHLGWDLSPLQARLTLYQVGKPWYGDLLEF